MQTTEALSAVRQRVRVMELILPQVPHAMWFTQPAGEDSPRVALGNALAVLRGLVVRSAGASHQQQRWSRDECAALADRLQVVLTAVDSRTRDSPSASGATAAADSAS